MKILTRWMTLSLLGACLAHAAEEAPLEPVALTAAQIVDNNVAARGGLDAWRKVESMLWTGRIDSVTSPAPNLSFVLLQQRPNRVRFEIDAMHTKTVRAFDGARGWKVLPAREGHAEPQPYNMQELKFAREAQVVDGPLIDYQAKGNKVEFDGVESIEGRRAYRLNVHLASGTHETVWVDAETFLDLRYDRTSYHAGGGSVTVSIYYRNYRDVDGLQIPFVQDIGGVAGKPGERMLIDKVTLNPPLDDTAFVEPGRAHRAASKNRARAAVRRPVENPVAATAAAEAMKSSDGTVSPAEASATSSASVAPAESEMR